MRLPFLLVTGFLLSLTTVAPATAEEPTRAWYLDEYRAADIWNHTQGEGITVAVIDTGVDSSVPELKDQVLEGSDFLDPAGVGHIDRDGHGTAMASLISGTGAGQGVQGLAPETKILPIRVSHKVSELGVELGTGEPILDAIEVAADSDAQILSIAVGTRGEDPRLQERIDEAIAEAARRGKLVFVAAGNEAHEGYRAATLALQDGAVGVGAVDRHGERAYYSQHGPFIGLAAPGQEIPLRCSHAGGAVCLREGGTSAASALASASAALIWSANPDWTKNQV
ncbi:S8 family serine peptidase, partial [Streptomyces sodiiphilus]|uniref:S8 family serine peptidase n=1 Tax=Streptomyces sodiiphilus TaxID=226217 RepID=UPI0031DB9983